MNNIPKKNRILKQKGEPSNLALFGVDYKIILKIQKNCVNCARHDYSNKYREQPEIKIYLPNFYKLHLQWSNQQFDFGLFVEDLIEMLLVERVCLECRVNKCRIKKRCKSFEYNDMEFPCKSDWAGVYMKAYLNMEVNKVA